MVGVVAGTPVASLAIDALLGVRGTVGTADALFSGLGPCRDWGRDGGAAGGISFLDGDLDVTVNGDFATVDVQVGDSDIGRCGRIDINNNIGTRIWTVVIIPGVAIGPGPYVSLGDIVHYVVRMPLQLARGASAGWALRWECRRECRRERRRERRRGFGHFNGLVANNIKVRWLGK